MEVGQGVCGVCALRGGVECFRVFGGVEGMLIFPCSPFLLPCPFLDLFSGHRANRLQQQHPLSMSLFSSYLLLDSILGSIPRLLLFTLHVHLLLPSSLPSSLRLPSHASPRLMLQAPDAPRPASLDLDMGVQKPVSAAAYRMAHCAQVLLLLVVVGSMVLQVLGAVCVRAYAKALWAREREAEGAEEGMVILRVDYDEGLDLGGDEEEGLEKRVVGV